MRGVLGETWLDFPAPDNKSEAEMIGYTETYLKKWQGDALIQAAVAPTRSTPVPAKPWKTQRLWRGNIMPPS